ncbi:IS110 family transposase [Williamsia sp. MIQD14]|uniref:IS110 family transposase n=1 Tax=Williamsia sp. MIQD14 TaxID=3425703 RepID=UPI003DA15B35
MSIYCGIDWASDHHDVAVVDEHGTPIVTRRIANDAAGVSQLLETLHDAGRGEADVPVAIETDHGLLVASMVAAGLPVYAINPLAAARYRTRHAVSGAKADVTDAIVLANIVRTDLHAHRPLPADSELAKAIRVLARAHQDAVWSRIAMGNKITALLGEYFPAAVAMVAMLSGGLTRCDVRTILRRAPTPTIAATLTPARLRGLLVKAGRERYIATHAASLRTILSTKHLRQPVMVEEAMAVHLLALLDQYDAAVIAEQRLAAAAAERFNEHPDAPIITSFPGLSTTSGARLLGEIGDDRARFADARGLKAYAGAAPVTRASGKKTVITHRRIKNNRLESVGTFWTLASLTASPGARAHYDRRRATGDWNRAAQRNLYNKFLGQLHTCLQSRTLYDEARAFGHQQRSIEHRSDQLIVEMASA